MKKTRIPNQPVGPFPVMLVGVEVRGKPNYATIGACGMVTLEPLLYISLKHGHHTTIGVRESGYFSVNIPSADMVPSTDYCGITSGNDVDKSSIFTPFYDPLGSAPMIQECSMNMLCKVIKSMPLLNFEMFFGEIVATYVNDECLTGGRPDVRKMDPMVLMGPTYWNLGRNVGHVFLEGTTFKCPAWSDELPPAL